MSTNAGLIRAFIQGAPVNPRRFVKLDGAGKIVQAGANDAAIIGVSDQVGVAETGARIDVRLTGTAEVEAGAADSCVIALTDAGAADDHAEVLVAVHQI